MSIELPEGHFPFDRTARVLRDGTLVLTSEGPRPTFAATLLLITPEMVSELTPTALQHEAFSQHTPVTLDDGDGLVVLTEPGTATRVDRDGTETPLRAPAGTEGFAVHDSAARLDRIAPKRTGDGPWLVVLAHSMLSQETPGLAELAPDFSGWSSPFPLDAAEFPGDRFGGHAQDDANRVTIGATLTTPEHRYVFVEGSDRGSTNKYGSDFSSCVEVDAGGRVLRKVWEESGYKRMPGKHGIDGAFTSDGRWAILTPHFASGPDKGKQRLLDLATGEQFRPKLPRGWTKARIIEGAEAGWWLLDRSGGPKVSLVDLTLEPLN